MSGYNTNDKFGKTGLKSKKSNFVDAPIIEGSPVVIECELVEIVNGTNFTTVLAKIKNIAADESVVDASGRIDSLKTGMILYDPFGTNYVSLGEIVGKPWSEGRKFM